MKQERSHVLYMGYQLKGLYIQRFHHDVITKPQQSVVRTISEHIVGFVKISFSWFGGPDSGLSWLAVPL